MKNVLNIVLTSLFVLCMTMDKAQALSYKHCNDPSQSPSCFIALAKLRTLTNPLTGKKFFDDGLHYIDGKVFIYPDLHIAEADLDNDGFKELIVKVPELADQLEGYFCKANYKCPHYIFQDRNTSKKPSLKKIKVLSAPIYTVAIGLSTDEVVGGFRSLRIYKDTKIKKFSVYQYDKKNDRYFEISAAR